MRAYKRSGNILKLKNTNRRSGLSGRFDWDMHLPLICSRCVRGVVYRVVTTGVQTITYYDKRKCEGRERGEYDQRGGHINTI